jgi:ATP-dependent helicase/nuclease subunit A
MNALDLPQFSRLNEEQRAAVLCGGNAVVAAGAGSGKTFVLACRYAYLVLEKGVTVDEILALTFTNKAVAEMYRRIYGILSEVARTADGVCRERAQRAVDSFFRARIQTLDSYSGAVVRQAANRYGIPPDFVTDDGRCAEIAETESLPFILKYREHPVVRELFKLGDAETLASALFARTALDCAAIDCPADFTNEARTQGEIIAGEWERLAAQISAILNAFDAAWDEDKRSPGLEAAGAPFAEKLRRGVSIPPAPEVRSYFEVLLACPSGEKVEHAANHPVRRDMVSLTSFLLGFAKIPKRGKHPALDAVREMSEAFSAFSSVAVFIAQFGLIAGAFDLLSEFQALYLRRKRLEGTLTFDDVARLARAILLEQEDIRRTEKAAYRAIMIDEFQDNNSLQRDILFLLAEKPDRATAGVPAPEDLLPGKLFFVGDEKQSIYRFRGADVSVFRKLQRDLPETGNGASLALRNNYRSRPELIGAFNAFFGGPDGASVFVRSGDSPDFEARYVPVSAPEQDNPAGEGHEDFPTDFRVCVLDAKEDADDGAEGLSKDECEAVFVAEKIRDITRQNPSIKYGDVAILLRSYSKLHWYEKHLRRRGIPYSGDRVGNLFADAPANDLSRFLRLLVYPADTDAYAAVLRSPLAGLSYRSLTRCLGAQNEQPGAPAPFTDEAALLLEAAERARYERGQRLYREFCEKSRSLSASELLTDLWYAQGYRYETLWNPDAAPYREIYDYLFEIARRADTDGAGLSGFVDALFRVQNDDEKLEDVEIPLEREDGVRILTVHKSKGLEFPVVFLCGAGSWSRREWADMVYVTGGQSFCGKRVGIKPPLPEELLVEKDRKEIKNSFFFEAGAADSRAQRRAELRRLLYVAMTRAEKAVYITGSFPLAHDGARALPVSLKQAVQGKREKQAKDRPDLADENILDDDTFFGMFLPVYADRFSDDGRAPAGFFPLLEQIPRLTRDDIGHAARPESLAQVLSRVSSLYQNARVLHTPLLPPNRTTPTALRESMNNALSLYPSIPLSFYPSVPLSPADFGTLVHACVEALFAGREPVIPGRIAALLSPAEQKRLLARGAEMARQFAASPLGLAAQNAAWRHSEYRFRSRVENPGDPGGVFIDGTIDLLFDTGDAVQVVDFKTDAVENPTEHAAQMACYYNAARALWQKPCRVWLYYLRSGNAVDVTEKCAVDATAHKMLQ